MPKNKKINPVYWLVAVALLTAIEIVLSRWLSFAQWNIKFSFSFIPVAIAAAAFGPLAGAAVGGLGDLIGALLFPIGTYFPGFTASAALVGLCLGLFLYKKRSFPMILLAVVVTELLFSQGANTYFIHVLYGSPFMPLFTTRLVQTGVMIVVKTAVLSLILDRIVKLIPTTNKKVH